jgi:hypothetical protein
MVFAAFNGAAFIHMFLTAAETKSKTLEEMDRCSTADVQRGRSLRKALGLTSCRKRLKKGAWRLQRM